MSNLKPEITTLAHETVVGGDAFMPGPANPVSFAEIKDIYTDPTVSVEDRKQALLSLRREMTSRGTTDRVDDMQALIAAIDEGLSILSKNPAGFADPQSLRQRDVAVDPENM